jgi:hypothetical protein
MPSWNAAGIRLYVLETECQYSPIRTTSCFGRMTQAEEVAARLLSGDVLSTHSSRVRSGTVSSSQYM